MVIVFQNAQVLLLAAALITACAAKLAVREPDAHEHAEVHGVPVPADRMTALRNSRPIAITMGLGEGALGVGLLVTSYILVRVATVAVFAAATWVVAELRLRRPDAGCGCFGGLSSKRVGRRSVARAGLFTVAALVATTAPASGLDLLAAGFGGAGVVLLVEVLVFAALSPELTALWERHRAQVPCELRRSPLSETYATLHASDPWQEHQAVLIAVEPLDVWRERCWRFLVYPARVDGQEVEIVFAVSTAERHRTVRAALVEPDVEDTGPNPHHAVPV